ncbi:hypothetical protein BJ684DRAFT_22041 [Piptocephalis cylindrospora]|uniref:Uncharacterized protein n=1 Tax=Piptocephalis cylindrospora TaxID=1907219 RepID=A0A4P9XYB5_9FUNG|nr:hypothetical protein BJ684DRAFT_22041 [Piptocephalis cylindrospora]|eukprot:RKP11398.1 hypothetical protein BJ684DRAFT_22041 [Piptocephalis cylindrospora]
MHTSFLAKVLTTLAVVLYHPTMASPVDGDKKQIEDDQDFLRKLDMPYWKVTATFPQIAEVKYCSGEYDYPRLTGGTCWVNHNFFKIGDSFKYNADKEMHIDNQSPGWLVSEGRHVTLMGGAGSDRKELGPLDFNMVSSNPQSKERGKPPGLTSLRYYAVQLDVEWMKNIVIYAFQINSDLFDGQCVISEGIWGDYQYPHRPTSLRTCAPPSGRTGGTRDAPTELEPITWDGDNTDTTTFMRTLFFATNDERGYTHINNLYDFFRKRWTCLDTAGHISTCENGNADQGWTFHPWNNSTRQ